MLKFILSAVLKKNKDVAFQNILCWSLSVVRIIPSGNRNYFKTSYVEVYPWRMDLRIIMFVDFKTSYVEVYLKTIY